MFSMMMIMVVGRGGGGWGFKRLCNHIRSVLFTRYSSAVMVRKSRIWAREKRERARWKGSFKKREITFKDVEVDCTGTVPKGQRDE